MERITLDKEGAGDQSGPVLAGKKVVVVEDDAFLGNILSQKINGEDTTLHLFKNGEDALAYFEKDTADIAILDIFLPGVDGLHVLEKLRQNEKTKNMPVLVISNAAENEYSERAKKLNAEFIIKAMTTPYEIVERLKKKLQEEK